MTDQIPTGKFPSARMRRNRRQNWSRELSAEARLSSADLIWPIFVHDESYDLDIESMTGLQRVSISTLLKMSEQAVDLDIPAIALFPSVDDSLKDENGTQAANPGNLVCRAVQAVKKEFPDLGIICDVALDPYTRHGQDGILVDGYVTNDATIEMLIKQSIVQAQAGCDVVAPSDMMDGRVGAIRAALDSESLIDTQIMSYAAKYNSGFYGPFRDAVGSAPSTTSRSGGKGTYQMDPANSDEAIREVAMDIEEGADSVIIKPGLPYLDILQRVKETFGVPTYVYQVSGEYAMLNAAAEKGWLDLDRVMMESLLGMKRAGADGIWTYFAPVVAKRLKG
jgi:porphobilinogen synthase